MNDVVSQIVDVKVLREDRAGEEQRRCRYALEEAARSLERAKRERADYRTWRIKREIELFDEIEKQMVKLRDLEDLKTDIGLMRGKESLFEHKIADAEKARATAQEALTVAEQALEAAIRARQKFEELAEMLDAEAKAYRERMEELELEEQFGTPTMNVDEQLGMKTEGRSLGLAADQFGTGQQGGQRQGAPEAEDVDAFARMMARPLKAAEEPRPEQPAPKLDGQGAGDAILRGLMGGAAQPIPAAAPEGPSRLIEQLAERVLVSEPEASGGREVRIAIKDSHFVGLEVRIAEREGRLEVVLVCRNAADFALLQGHVQGLLQRLGQRTQRPVEVRVERAQEADDSAAGEALHQPWRPAR